jgi:matrixin
MRRFVSVLCIAAAVSLVGIAGAAAFSINLIAPWGPSVYQSSTKTITLTYSISASKPVSATATTAASNAASAWATWLGSESHHHFVVVQAVGGVATVPITIKNGGGQIAGSTKLSFDRQGFIAGARVQISGSSFGLANNPDTVYEITLHELGHAFVGLGHSNDPNDLMYPYLNGVTTIGACESSGYSVLYSWLGSSNPILPAVGSVTC